MSTRVPTVESPFKAPEVRPEITPDVREHIDIPSNEDVNQRYAQGAEEVKKSAEDYMKQAQEHADFAIQNNYETKMGLLKDNLVGKAEDYKGTNAFEAVSPAAKAFDESAKSLRSGITDQRQQQAFDNLTAKYKDRLSSEIGAHVASQIPIIDAKAIVTRKAQMMHTISNNYDNPSIVNQTLNDLHDMNEKAAKVNHWTPEAIQKENEEDHAMVRVNISDQKKDHNLGYQIPDDLKKDKDAKLISEDQYQKLSEHYKPDVNFSEAYQEFYGDKNEGIKGIYDDESKKFFDKQGNVKPQQLWDYVRNHERFKGDEDHAQAVYNDMWRFAKIQEGKIIGEKADEFRAWENFVITQKEKYDQTKDPRYSYDSTVKQWAKYSKEGDPVSRNDLTKIAAGAYAPPDIRTNPEYKVNFKIGIKPGDDSVYQKMDQLKKDKDLGKISVQDYSDCLEHVDSVLSKGSGTGLDKGKVLAVDNVDEMLKNKFGESSEQYYKNRDAFDSYLKGKDLKPDEIRKWANENLLETPGSEKKVNAEFFKNLSGAWNTFNVPTQQPLYRNLTTPEEQVRTAKYVENLKTKIGPSAQDIVKDMKHSGGYKDIDSVNNALDAYLSKPEGVETVKKAIDYLKSIPPDENGNIVPITVEHIEKAIEGGYTVGNDQQEYSKSITTPGSKRLKVNKTKVE
jgi:hypothetical protein